MPEIGAQTESTPGRLETIVPPRRARSLIIAARELEVPSLSLAFVPETRQIKLNIQMRATGGQEDGTEDLYGMANNLEEQERVRREKSGGKTQNYSMAIHRNSALSYALAAESLGAEYSLVDLHSDNPEAAMQISVQLPAGHEYSDEFFEARAMFSSLTEQEQQ